MRPQATDRGTGQVKSKQQIVGESKAEREERWERERKKERNLFTFIKPRSETIKTKNKMDKNETPTLNFGFRHGQVVQRERESRGWGRATRKAKKVKEQMSMAPTPTTTP